MQQNRFAKYTQQQATPVYGAPPTQADLQEQALDERKMNIDEQRLGMDQVKLQREMQDGGGATQGYTDAGKLRDEFMKSQSVKDITAVLPSYSAALQTPDTPEGDMSLVYAFAKMMDPNSVVRESEFESAAGNDTVFGQTIARIKKEAFNGGRLRPEARQRLRAEMIRRFGEMQEAYNADRGRYARLAERGGFDPMLVVEQNHVQPYADDFRGAAADMRQMGGGQRNPQTGVLANGNEGGALDLGPIIGGQDPNSPDPNYQQTLQQEYAKEGVNYQPEVVNDMMSRTDAAGSFVRGAGDTALFGMVDEIRAGGQALGGALSGDGSFVDLYNQNVANERAYQGQLANVRPISYHGGQIAGAVALPYGSGVRSVKGLAALGTGEGAAYGFGSGEGTVGSLAGAAVGAPLGAAGGATIGAIAPKVTGKLSDLINRQPSDFNPEVVRAGQRMDVPVRQPDAIPSKRNEFAAAEATRGGGPQIVRTVGKDGTDQTIMKQRVAELGGAGRVKDRGGMGDIAQGASNRASDNLKARAKVHYNRVDSLAPGFTMPPTQTTRAIDDTIAALESGGSRATEAERKFFADIRDDLNETGLSVQSLQTHRETARKKLQTAGIDHNAAQGRLDEVMRTMGQELEAGLAGNPQAQQAFKRANELWAERADFNRTVRDWFTGKKGDIPAESAGRKLEAMFGQGGDSARFKQVWDKMSPDEQMDVQATILEGLATRGRNDFSLANLDKSIGEMNPRTMIAAFGKDGAKALRDIRILAKAKADTLGSLNHSKSGVVNEHNGNRNVRSILLGALGFGAGDLTGAAGGMIAGNLWSKFAGSRKARALLNPDFTKLLVQAPNSSSPAAAKAYSNRLTAVAAKNPVIAGEIKALQSALTEAFAQSPGRAAAQQEQDGR